MAIKTGRPPKPKATKILQGTYRPDRDGGADAALGKSKPYCPSWLDDDAKNEWKRISNELYDAGLLLKVDGTALANYCVNYSIWKQASLKVQKHGIIIKTKNGHMIQSPALNVANVAARDMMKALREFGMTPSSRATLVPDKPEEKELTLAEQIFNTVNS